MRSLKIIFFTALTIFLMSGTAFAMSESKPVPEPGTMLLLGAGLIALAAFGRSNFIK